MTSKEAIQELYNEREYLLGEKVHSKTKTWHNDITHYDNINHCLLTIREDLDRLEKLEKVIDILVNKKVNILVLKYCIEKDVSIENYNFYNTPENQVTQEEYELLKEVFEND